MPTVSHEIGAGAVSRAGVTLVVIPHFGDKTICSQLADRLKQTCLAGVGRLRPVGPKLRGVALEIGGRFSRSVADPLDVRTGAVEKLWSGQWLRRCERRCRGSLNNGAHCGLGHGDRACGRGATPRNPNRDDQRAGKG